MLFSGTISIDSTLVLSMILSEAGSLISLQERIKVQQADFTLHNVMHMVSVDMDLQSSCLLLDRPQEESGL